MEIEKLKLHYTLAGKNTPHWKEYKKITK